MRAVVYDRVPAAHRLKTGFGLAEQKAAVEALCATNGWEIITPPYFDIENSRYGDRPRLKQAVLRARLIGAKLVIAKPDRLSPDDNLFFLAVRDANVPIVTAEYSTTIR